jgi:hypothetical protein
MGLVANPEDLLLARFFKFSVQFDFLELGQATCRRSDISP